MAINTGRGSANTLVFGPGSHLKIAEQPSGATASARKRTDADNFSRYKVAVNSMTVTPTSTLLTPRVIPTTVEQRQGAAGPLAITGSFVTDAFAKRTEIFWRQLLNAPSASVTDITSGSGIGSGTAQTIVAAGGTLPIASAGITQISATQPPIRLTVVLAAGTIDGSTAPTAGNPLRLTLTGTDYSDNVLNETLTFTGATGSQTTQSFFKTLTSINESPTAGTGTVTVTGTSNRKGVQVQSSATYRQTPGLTVEVIQGNTRDGTRVPNTITDSFLNTFSFTASREDLIAYNFGLTGRLYDAGVGPSSDPAERTAGFADDDRATSGTDGAYGDGAFKDFQDGQAPFAGWQACLEAQGQVLPQIVGLSFNFDNNTNYTPRLWTFFPGISYVRQRTITFEATLEYHVDDRDFAAAYLSARNWDDVVISLANRGLGAEPDEIRFVMDQVQLSEYPSTPIEDDDFVQQTIRGIVLPSGGSAADSITIQTYYDEIESGVELSKANLALRALS